MKKKIVVPIIYWLLIGLSPILFGSIFGGNGSILLWYIIIGPIVFSFIPYKIVNPQSKKEKVKFIIFGLLIPLLMIYAIYLYLIVMAFKRFSPIM